MPQSRPNEKFRQLRLKARAVAHFMDGMGLPLTGCPEFVDEIGQTVIFDSHRCRAKIGKGANVLQKIRMGRCR